MRTLVAGKPTARSPRRAFTLLELLMSIVIISVLMALLIPAVNSVRLTAQVAQVRSEISELATALTDFKAKYGEYPPSRIVLYEQATGDPSWVDDTTSLPTSRTMLAASKTIIKRLWPQFDFTINRDINGNGDTVDRIELTGPECLVFFLGGMRNSDGVQMLDGVSGFSASPSNPFARGGGSRIGPFHEFNISHLVDQINVLNPTTPNGMYEFLDALSSQTRPYVYASAYEGSGYRTAALGVTGVDDLLGTGMNDIYRQTATGSPPPAWNSKTYQLISPGFDNAYGTGGPFNPNTADVDFVNRDLNSDGDFLDANEREGGAERDNITNFHSGMLAP